MTTIGIYPSTTGITLGTVNSTTSNTSTLNASTAINVGGKPVYTTGNYLLANITAITSNTLSLTLIASRGITISSGTGVVFPAGTFHITLNLGGTSVAGTSTATVSLTAGNSPGPTATLIWSFGNAAVGAMGVSVSADTVRIYGGGTATFTTANLTLPTTACNTLTIREIL